MRLLLYKFIAIGLTYSVEGIDLEALAFGNRVFSVESTAFSNFQETNILISVGHASLINPPTKGTLKSSDCSDSIDFNGSLQIQNELLTFCYEGGREMLSGGTDTFTLEIISANSDDSVLFTVNLIGNDPVKPRPLANRVLQLLEDELFSFSARRSLVIVDPEATELSDFVLRFDEVPSRTQILMIDFEEVEAIVSGSIARDDDLRLSPFDRFANCAFGGFNGLLDCDKIISSIDALVDILDHFTVRIGFIGNDEEEIVFGEPFDFFYTVRLRTGSIISPEIFRVDIISFSTSDVFSAENDLVTLLPDSDESETFFEIKLTVLSGLIRITSGFALNVFRFGPECAELGDPCFLILKGRPDDLIEYIEEREVLFVIDVDDIANCSIEVNLNRGEQINIVQLALGGSEDDVEEQPDDVEDQFDEEPVEAQPEDIDDQPDEEPVEEDPGQPEQEPQEEPSQEQGQPGEEPQQEYEDTIQDEPEETPEEEPEDPQNQPIGPDPNTDNAGVEGALIGIFSGTGVLVVVILLGLIGYFIIKKKEEDNSDIPQGVVVDQQ